MAIDHAAKRATLPLAACRLLKEMPVVADQDPTKLGGALKQPIIGELMRAILERRQHVELPLAQQLRHDGVHVVVEEEAQQAASATPSGGEPLSQGRLP